MHASLKINYPPRFAARWGYERPNAEYIEKIFLAKHQEQLEFVETIGKFAEQLNNIPVETQDVFSPRWAQNWFPPFDGISAYVLAASRRPSTIFEIGSGNSTKFFARAARNHSAQTQIISVDPQPREEIDKLCSRIHRAPLEDLDLQEFDVLAPGDILFFDGSHRSFQNSDVSVFFIDVLPRMPDGVVVGIHDIFWPVDYPKSWVDRYYNEQYLLGAYMLAYGEHFPLISSASYSWRNLMPEIHAALPESLVAALPRISGGSIWFEKRSVTSIAG